MSHLRKSAATAAAVLLATFVSAEPVPEGDEIHVDPDASVGGRTPDVAELTGGGFAVVWESADASRSGVFAQVFDAGGEPLAVAPFQVNTYTTDDQDNPSVAALPDGGFIVAWDSFPFNTPFGPGCCPQDGHDGGIVGRRFDATGSAIGDDFLVNTYTTGHQIQSEVDSHSDGFVVTWATPGASFSSKFIVARRFDAEASPLGAEFLTHDATTHYLHHPHVAAADDGSFVVAWNSNDTGHVYARRVGSNGSPLGSAFQVSTGDDGDVSQFYSTVARSTGGDFVVAWLDVTEDKGGPSVDIFARRFDANGAEVGTEFQVNTYTTSVRFPEAAEVLADGSLVITWRATNDGGASMAGPYLRRFLDDGEADGGELYMSSIGGTFLSATRLARTNDGGFLAAFNDVTTGSPGLGPVVRKFGVGAALCGDATGDDRITAPDALVTLQTAVGAGDCPLCVCDVNNDGNTTAGDALAVLNKGVGQPVELVCAPC